MKVLVCGSRDCDWDDVVRLNERLNELPADASLILGGARGIDRDAQVWARRNNRDHEVFHPDWVKYGRRAGIVRNLEMLDQNPDLVIAFWNGTSRGTAHTISAAKERGIPVEVHRGAQDEVRAPQPQPNTQEAA